MHEKASISQKNPKKSNSRRGRGYPSPVLPPSPLVEKQKSVLMLPIDPVTLHHPSDFQRALCITVHRIVCNLVENRLSEYIFQAIAPTLLIIRQWTMPLRWRFNGAVHGRRLHWGDRPHGQKVVGAIPLGRPHVNFVMAIIWISA